MDTLAWQQWFEDNNRKTYLPIPDRIELRDPVLARELAAVLSWFQRGETGEGRIVNEARTCGDSLVDDAFARAIALYIAEEGKHARQLGMLVRALGGTPVETLRAEGAFRHVRRALGFRHKMLVLTAAEIIGLVSYELISESVHNTIVQDALEQIAADERQHLILQVDFFREAVRASPRILRPLHSAALVVLLASVLLLGNTYLYWGQWRFFRKAKISFLQLHRHSFRAGSSAIAAVSRRDARKRQVPTASTPNAAQTL